MHLLHQIKLHALFHDLSLSKYLQKRLAMQKEKKERRERHMLKSMMKEKKEEKRIAQVQNKGEKRERWSCKKEFHNLDGNN
jgi:hypothetical protein